MKQQNGYKFRNWGRNIQCEVSCYYQPETEEELIELIKSHDQIRMVGSGHSWSAVNYTEGIQINLDHYNKILEIDREKKQITVQAGIKMKQLNKVLAQNGLALKNQGSIDQQSIAGAISTGTHGTGVDFQILGAQMIAFTLIKADGTKVTIHKKKTPELYKAAVVNLGCLGVISELTLQAVDAFNLHDYTCTMNFEEVIDNLDKLVSTNDHLKLWWFPPTDEIIVFRYQRTQNKTNDTRFRRFVKDEMLSVGVYRLMIWLTKHFKSTSVRVNRFLTWNMKKPLDRIAESSTVFIVPEPPVHRETEWAFDLRNARQVLREYKKMIIDQKYRLNFIQEIRFTKGDDFWLSGCHGRDTMWLGFYGFKHEDWESNLADFEAFAKRHKGRPHWGKEFTLSPGYLQQQYPHYKDFVTLRKKMDPKDKFANAYIKALFGKAV